MSIQTILGVIAEFVFKSNLSNAALPPSAILEFVPCLADVCNGLVTSYSMQFIEG